MAATEEPDLFRSVNQALQVGVSSGINERVFSGWGHIMGKRRTRMGKKRQVSELFVYTNRRVAKRTCQGLAASAADSGTESDNESGIESGMDDGSAS